MSSAGKSNQLEYFVNSTSNWRKVTPLQVKVYFKKVTPVKSTALFCSLSEYKVK